jgi:uncharacterized protein YecE (DUF72 family)
MLFAGTSGWAYPAWKPAFYPPKLAAAKFLSHYASRLNAVEVNYTFRHLLTEKTVQGWLAQTPAGFRFCIKAHQALTHIRRLKNTAEFLQRFLASVEPLAAAGRLGVVLFQLPPNLKADPVLLEDFLALLPRAVRASFEYRHESWFAEPIFDVLHRHNAALCLAESEKLETPDVVTADFSYYRFRKPEYSADERRRLANRLLAKASTRDIFAFFKHEENPQSALNAVDLLASARAA